ncbi:hypothetical protein DL766_000134 [Monosporascus sp. MC13-8B]|uniref:Uncharacterized protein n=1 Tax=Monosporascus cannonballus TaxID=155416 RepID=A0ABY0HF22_9PEZI|nr:hypothetical protein DL762_002335 [Monosporascus cannonballus]RYP40110.1 hypothetical protein DL766_000134 [Monosporascus sp. MC13-8B]
MHGLETIDPTSIRLEAFANPGVDAGVRAATPFSGKSPHSRDAAISNARETHKRLTSTLPSCHSGPASERTGSDCRNAYVTVVGLRSAALGAWWPDAPFYVCYSWENIVAHKTHQSPAEQNPEVVLVCLLATASTYGFIPARHEGF